MKKIFAILFMVILTTFIYLNTNKLYAYNMFEEELEWSIVYQDETYLLKSKRDGIDYSHLTIELWTDTTTYDMQYALNQFIVLTHNSYTTTINIYPSLHSQTLTTKFDFIEDTIHQDDLLYSNDNGSSNINLTSYQNQYLEIQLVLNPMLTQTERDAVLNYFNQKEKDPITCIPSYNLLEYPYAIKDKPATLDDSWWHVIEGNKAYIHLAPTYRYIPNDTEVIGESAERADAAHFNDWSLSRIMALNTLVWPETHGITKPGLEWNKLVIEVRYNDGTEELIYNGIVDHGFYIYSGITDENRSTNTWGIKTLKFENGRQALQDEIYVNKYFTESSDKDVDAIKMYFTKDENTQIITSVNELPSTIGSGYGYESIDEIGLAYIEVNGTDALLTVSYQSASYKLNYTNFNTDFLTGIYQAYYFTHNNNKILHLIYERSPLSIIEVDTNEIINRRWTPYVHWNLNTDEIISTEKISVLTYFKQEEAQNVYAYFYMPDIVSDKLIHVDMTFDYRYYKAGFPDIWNEYPMESQKASVSLDYDETTLTTPEWKKDLYVVTPVAMTIGAMIPVIRWPVLIIGSSLLAVNYASTEFNILQKEISQIEPITPSIDLKAEVEASYERMTGNPVIIDTVSNNLYKLHIGQFDDRNKVEIMENSENVTNIVYEVYGQRILIQEDYIQDQFDRDENLGVGDEPTILPDFGGGVLTYVLIFIGILALINILPKLDKFLNSIFKIISNPKKLVALVFIVIILLVIFKIV